MKKGSKKEFSRLMALLCVTTLSSGLLLGGCGNAEAKTEEEDSVKDTSILVETAMPKTENIELTGDFIGTVQAESEVTVMSKLGGDVTATYFEVGDHVNAGDLLFTVDDRSVQISMAQAQAGLESANAAVHTATAGASAAELNLLYTQEQIKETLGKVDTNQMQLENAVASAKYAIKAAQENEAMAAEQFGLARDAYEELESNLDDLRDNADNAGEYVEYLENVKDNFFKLKSMTDADARDTVVTKMKLSLDKIGCDDSSTAAQVAEGYLMATAKVKTEYELGAMITGAEAQESSLRSSRSSLDGSKDQVRLAQIQAAIGKETAKNNVLAAEDGKRLAEKMLQDYELYTKAVILAGANAQLAGSNSSLIAAQSGLAQAQAGVKQAQAGLEAAKLQMEYTQVSAPVAGIITQKNVTVNNMTGQGTPAYVIAADDAANVVFYVAETVMLELATGQEIDVERNGEYYKAVISENTGIPDAASGLFKIKAQLTTGADKLINGTSVKLTMATQKAESVMTIPVDSVYYESQKAYVYCVEDGKAVKTMIETGITNNESVEVKSGLTADSQVITTWAAQLKDGSEIRIKGETSKADADASGEEVQVSMADGSEESDDEMTDTRKLSLSIEERIMLENEAR